MNRIEADEAVVFAGCRAPDPCGAAGWLLGAKKTCPSRLNRAADETG